MGDMCVVTEDQLQGMFTWCKVQHGLSLALAEMDVVLVCRDGHIHRWQPGIDQDVMMAGIFHDDAGRCDPHTLQAELDCNRTRDRRAIDGGNKVDPGTLGRRCSGLCKYRH